MRNHGDGLDGWMKREMRREIRRAVIVGLIVIGALTWGIYGR